MRAPEGLTEDSALLTLGDTGWGLLAQLSGSSPPLPSVQHPLARATVNAFATVVSGQPGCQGSAPVSSAASPPASTAGFVFFTSLQ